MFWRLLVLWLASFAAGCGSSGLVAVSGTVTMGGQPLKAGSVAFHPDTSKGNTSQHIPAGMVVDGNYVLFTNGQKGAPPGAYKVTVVANDFSGGAAPEKGATATMPRSLIAEKYGDQRQTPLSAEVVARPAAGAYDFQVTRR